MTRLCLHKNATDMAIFTKNDQSAKTMTDIFDLNAYVDLYVASRLDDDADSSDTAEYIIEFSNSLISNISFQNQINIDGQRFPTVDDISRHLTHMYGPEYMH
jgi:hypothetical protein